MILADKIIMLRKKNGWSQEELAEKMNVSRQAVSKWEGAQTIPDLGKILQMARLFGVTTDYLLKDELETEEHTREDEQPDLRKIGMEEAGIYLESRVKAAKRIALGALLCILSPVAMLLLLAGAEGGWGISNEFAVGVGLVILLFFVVAAVGLFVYTGFQNTPYEFLENGEGFECEYGVEGMVREKQKAFRKDYVVHMVFGICACVISPVPLFLGIFGGTDFQMMSFLCVTIAVVGAVFTSWCEMGYDGKPCKSSFGKGIMRQRRRKQTIFGSRSARFTGWYSPPSTWPGAFSRTIGTSPGWCLQWAACCLRLWKGFATFGPNGNRNDRRTSGKRRSFLLKIQIASLGNL
ncbi:MAG: helix-turn-helix transcriptional regulator [Clostridia bacterium]|nr:helix-turn-helix transcriptional regulator [Clostridia bacterium]